MCVCIIYGVYRSIEQPFFSDRFCAWKEQKNVCTNVQSALPSVFQFITCFMLRRFYPKMGIVELTL